MTRPDPLYGTATDQSTRAALLDDEDVELLDSDVEPDTDTDDDDNGGEDDDEGNEDE